MKIIVIFYKNMEMKKIYSLLEALSKDERLIEEEKESIVSVLRILDALKYNKEEQHYDFQGWKLKKLTMKDLKNFVNTNQSLDDNLSVMIYEDDGMGYCGKFGSCSDIELSKDSRGNEEIRFWF